MKHAGKKRKSRIVSLRIDEDDFARLEALAKQTSCSRAEVLRRCLTGAQRNDFRHGAITTMCENNPDLPAIAYLVGHRHLTTTAHCLHARRQRVRDGHHFVATRAAERDARAIRLLKSRQRERHRSSEEREL